MKLRYAFALAACGLLGTVREAAAQTVNFLTVQLPFKAVAQGDELGQPVIEKASLSSQELQNLAMGRARDAEVPEFEALVLSFVCSGTVITDAYLATFHLGTQSIIDVVADINVDAADVAGDDSNVVLVSDMSFQNLGDETNGIDDGDWTLYATLRRGPTGCPVSAKATAVGVISIDVGGSDLDLVVPKASLKGSLIHTLIIP